MNPLPEFCSCGEDMITMRRPTFLGAYSTCGHCDVPCPADPTYIGDYLGTAQQKIVRGGCCDSCVILTIDRTDAPDGAL